MERKRRDERKRRKGKAEQRKSGWRKKRKEKKKNPFQPFQSLLHHFSLCCLACMRTAKARPAMSKAASEAHLKNVFILPFYGELSEEI